MCGICGIANLHEGEEVSEKILCAMRDTLTHRGPDEAGVHLDGRIGLGHRRLSIIDLSTGTQPIHNEDSTLWIVFNGEIYNYQELRPSLEARGHVFKTNSDTEVLLRMYEEYGHESLQYLNGMFAYAIYDQKKKEIFLARDRIGIKPLYYLELPGRFLFASETKAIQCFNFLTETKRSNGKCE